MSHRLTRRTWAALGILLVAIPALMAVFVCVWDCLLYTSRCV